MADNAAETSAPFLKMGKDQTEAFVGLQKELLDAYEQASRAWLDRVKSEAELWSQLTTRLSGTRSPTEAAGAYQEWMGEHVKMAVDDGRRLTDDCQHFIEKVTRSFGNGRPTAGT